VSRHIVLENVGEINQLGHELQNYELLDACGSTLELHHCAASSSCSLSGAAVTPHLSIPAPLGTPASAPTNSMTATAAKDTGAGTQGTHTHTHVPPPTAVKIEYTLSPLPSPTGSELQVASCVYTSDTVPNLLLTQYLMYY
jgi:hypothetical protein